MRSNAMFGVVGLAATMTLSSIAWAQDDQSVVRIGYAVSKSGPNAGGTAASTIPNYELWVNEVNGRGGLMVDGERLHLVRRRESVESLWAGEALLPAAVVERR